MTDQLERMRSIVAQALAEGARGEPAARLTAIHLDLYDGIDAAEVRALYAKATQGTAAQAVPVTLHPVGSRYICWNCCGLRFEGNSAMCPNCGEDALEVPPEISFALRKVETAP